MKAEDPAKKGVCSNWLCDAKPGDEIQLTGPTGKVRAVARRTAGKAASHFFHSVFQS